MRRQHTIADVPKVSLVDASTVPATDAVVVGVRKGTGGARLAPGAAPVDDALGGRLLDALTTAGATGKADEVVKIPTFGLAPFPLVVGTGIGTDAGSAEAVRRAVGAALRGLTGRRRVHVAIEGPVAALAEGADLGAYAFTAYKSGAATQALRTVTVAGDKGARADLRRAAAVTAAVTLVRDLVNTPPNDLYPQTFAERIVAAANDTGVSVEVLDERALRRGKYGGVLAVGGGSARPPRLVRLTHKPKRALARVALVGKGITFDSGGLNIKTANMTWMKSDMGGAAAALASVLAAAALNLPVEVTATAPMAENMPSGTAYRPSDVLTMRSGSTVEVDNTDAEGRLILADGISRAAEDDPDYLIELSTLTGAQLVALGTRVIGAMGEPAWRDRVVAAGNAAGEAVWAMPIPEELRAGLDSPVADLRNITGDRWGGMLAAAAFLADFVPDGLPWVHLDIAGPAWNLGGAHGYTPKGATGAGVRTVLATLSELAAG
jgi:leucyl aminopeptidase